MDKNTLLIKAKNAAEKAVQLLECKATGAARTELKNALAALDELYEQSCRLTAK